MPDQSAIGFSPSIYSQLAAPTPVTPVNSLANLLGAAQTASAVTGLQQHQVDLVHSQVGAMKQAFGTIAANPNPTEQNFADLANNYVAQGYLTPQQAATEMSRVYAQNGDAVRLRSLAKDYLLQVQNEHDQFSDIYGQPTSINTGPQTNVVAVSPLTGVRPLASLQNGLGPSDAATPLTGPPTASGAPTVISKGAYAEGSGLAPPGTYTGAGQNGAPIPVSVDSRTGRIVSRPGGSAAVGGAVPPARTSTGQIVPTNAEGQSVGPDGQPATVGSPMVTGVSLGQGAVLKGSGDQYLAFQQNQATYAQQMQQLQTGLKALQSTNTGPGTESRQAISSWMLALPGGIGSWLPGTDPDSVKAYDEAQKYLTAAAIGQPGATGSDARQDAAIRSNPSVHISNAAAQDVQKANIGFRRAEGAAQTVFSQSGVDPGTFSNWYAGWNKRVDPRAFSIDLVDPAKRAAFVDSLKGTDRQRFADSLKIAIGTGAIDPSSLQGSQ